MFQKSQLPCMIHDIQNHARVTARYQCLFFVSNDIDSFIGYETRGAINRGVWVTICQWSLKHNFDVSLRDVVSQSLYVFAHGVGVGTE